MVEVVLIHKLDQARCEILPRFSECLHQGIGLAFRSCIENRA
jgi:hypothetical protein